MANTPNSARNSPPADVCRQLRQESGFGCCFCGHPFIQYHHIVPWSVDAHFRPEDMMAVCGNHHHLCTVGALSNDEQRAAKAHPFNVLHGELRGLLYTSADKLKVDFGGGTAINTPDLLSFRGSPVLRATKADDGRVLMSALITDGRGRSIATLRENEWRVATREVWDFDCHPRVATIRLAPRQIAFAVDARKDHISIRGNWMLGGMPIEFGPKAVRFGMGNVVQGMTMIDCGGFLNVG